MWASEAKVRFRSNQGDSVGGANYHAYDLVGRIGRRLLRSLGREGTAQALAIAPVLDSLGLETDVRVDPDLPYFVLLMVRNPYRPTASAVGFLFWYRNEDLRVQGALFPGGHQPQMKVWWTGSQRAPYSWGVVDRTAGDRPRLRITLFRLTPDGSFWTLDQYDDTGIEVGTTGTTSWVDVDGDERAELVAWIPATEDSLIQNCSNCPRLLNELILVERPEGMRLLDTRLVPTPYATFSQFVRLLIQNQRESASRLLKDRGLLARALADGWNVSRGPRTWSIEEVEGGSRWPRWMTVRFRSPKGVRRYRVDLEPEHGRWIIRDWSARGTEPARGAAPATRTVVPRGVVRSAPPDTGKGRP